MELQWRIGGLVDASYSIPLVLPTHIDNSGLLLGRHSLKSVHGSYLRAIEPDWKVDMVRRNPKEWENWYIEDFHGEVALKGRGGPRKPGQYLQARRDGTVDLSGAHPNNNVRAKWVPFRNENGSWSLLSAYSTWLSARPDGSVTTVGMNRRTTCEEFWPEFW